MIFISKSEYFCIILKQLQFIYVYFFIFITKVIANF